MKAVAVIVNLRTAESILEKRAVREFHLILACAAFVTLILVVYQKADDIQDMDRVALAPAERASMNGKKGWVPGVSPDEAVKLGRREFGDVSLRREAGLRDPSGARAYISPNAKIQSNRSFNGDRGLGPDSYQAINDRKAWWVRAEEQFIFSDDPSLQPSDRAPVVRRGLAWRGSRLPQPEVRESRLLGKGLQVVSLVEKNRPVSGGRQAGEPNGSDALSLAFAKKASDAR